jgi:hypothetical protein
MERIFFKGLLLIVGIWAIWNSSKVIPVAAKNTLEDSRAKAKAEAEAPIVIKTQPDETAAQKTGGKFYIRELED